MAKTYKEIFADYDKYSDKVTNFGMGAQSLFAGTNLIAGLQAANEIEYQPGEKVTPGQISLNSYDITSGATRRLDRGFNSMLNAYRERNKDINPALLSGFAEGALNISLAQAKLDTEIGNKSRLATFESRERAKSANAQLASRDAQMEYDLSLKKAGMKVGAIDKATTEFGNIINLSSRNTANKFNAALLGQPYITAEEKMKLAKEAKSRALFTANANADVDASHTELMNDAQDEYDSSLEEATTPPELLAATKKSVTDANSAKDQAARIAQGKGGPEERYQWLQNKSKGGVMSLSEAESTELKALEKAKEVNTARAIKERAEETKAAKLQILNTKKANGTLTKEEEDELNAILYNPKNSLFNSNAF